MATSKREISKSETQKVPDASGLVTGEDVPEYLRGASSRGNEGVSAGDMIVPRLEMVQSLSPARDKSSPEYVPGAEEGLLFNSITRRLYGESVSVIPVFYRHAYTVWLKSDKGAAGKGGFRGSFSTQAEAGERVRNGMAEGEALEVVDAHEHFVLLLSPAGVEEAVISMARSKSKVSKRWNSLIRIAGGDRFSRAYKVSAVQEQNARGEKYYNFKIDVAGFPSKPLYERAAALYESIRSSGRTVHAPSEDESGSGGEQSEY